MEGLLYLQKYGIGGPDFGIKEECVTEKVGEREIIYLSLHCHDQNAGIKMEGLLYLQKYGIGGPDFGIKEECVTEKGRHLLEKL